MAATRRPGCRPGAPRLTTLALGVAWALGLVPGLLVSAQAGQGLSVRADDDAAWPRWQARLQWLDAPATRWSLFEGKLLAPARRAALLGDVDLGNFGLQLPFAQGRFRATSGLLLGLREGVLLDRSLSTSAYLGLGWSGWVPGTGLSFSADLGLTHAGRGAPWELEGLRLGPQAADAAGRDARLQPRLQLGVQYRY